MRLFTALEISRRDQRKIYDWKEQTLSTMLHQVPQQNYHITLNFFGELPSKKLGELVHRLDETMQEDASSAIDLNLDQLEFWPKHGLLWIGPSTTPNPLKLLAKRHRKVGAMFGCRQSHPNFQPHVTLARGALHPPEGTTAPDIQIRCEHVVLYESQRLSESKPHYHAVEKWPLTQRLW